MHNLKDISSHAFLALHISVLLAGFTGLFGRLISLDEVNLVWYRLLFTSVILLVALGLPRIGWRKAFAIAGCGTLLGLHWILFYGSIKASNVSIGVVCFASIGFFTSIFEPLLNHRRPSWTEMAIALITIAGVWCIFSFDSRYRFGIVMGLVSAAVCSLYAITNKKVSSDVPSRTVLTCQMVGGLVGVSALIPLYWWLFPSPQNALVLPGIADLLWLLVLSIFCTAGLYLLQIIALKQLSAFTVNLTYNLEPCYTIAIAFLFFGEGRQVNAAFYVGLSLVVLSVALQTWRSVRQRKSIG